MDAARKLRMALDLFEAGEQLMRQQLRRRFPEETTADIEARVNRWLAERPGARDGDVSGGRRVPWPPPPKP